METITDRTQEDIAVLRRYWAADLSGRVAMRFSRKVPGYLRRQQAEYALDTSPWGRLAAATQSAVQYARRYRQAAGSFAQPETAALPGVAKRDASHLLLADEMVLHSVRMLSEALGQPDPVNDEDLYVGLSVYAYERRRGILGERPPQQLSIGLFRYNEQQGRELVHSIGLTEERIVDLPEGALVHAQAVIDSIANDARQGALYHEVRTDF